MNRVIFSKLLTHSKNNKEKINTAIKVAGVITSGVIAQKNGHTADLMFAYQMKPYYKNLSDQQKHMFNFLKVYCAGVIDAIKPKIKNLIK